MATLNPPVLSRIPRRLDYWDLIGNTWEHRAPGVGGVQTVEQIGALWAFSAIWMNLRWADRAIIEGWLAKLGGRAGRFYFSHPKWRAPRGTARGTGTCSAATQFATTITLNGLAAGATLLAGDFIEVGTAFLLRVTDDATANGSGVMVVNVGPMLRQAIVVSTAFTLVQPRAQFMIDVDRSGMGVDRGAFGQGFGEFTLTATEAYL